MRSTECIVSLTSWPGRINTVHIAIESLLNQTVKADKVILWLAPEQFPNKEGDLPDNLLSLTDKGLTIDWYHDIGSYKKLIPTLKKYPDAVVITVDDDLIYNKKLIELLIDSYNKDNHSIHCHRVSRLCMNEYGELKYVNRELYLDSKGQYLDKFHEPSAFNKLSGGAGTLYPPKSLHNDVFDEKTFMTICPTSDDIWFYIHCIRNGYFVKVVNDNIYNLDYINNTQECGLCKINDGNGGFIFYKHLNAVINKYQDVNKILVNEKRLSRDLAILMSGKDYNCFKVQLINWYKMRTKKNINLDNPQTFNEKIQWLKLYDSTPIKTRLADKYLVREWVAGKIGEKYLIPLLGVYDHFDEIDFGSLPNRFVLKCNHGSAYNIIVKDKTLFDLGEARIKVQSWMKENFAYKFGFELHYRDITPKIIIEQFIENKSVDDLYDYKFWCFDGKVKYIQFLSERNLGGLKEAFYDTSWKKQSFNNAWNIDSKEISKPNNLEDMISLAEKLSNGFSYVRVDFYRLDDGTLYFGEMTFTPASGVDLWTDKSIAKMFGDWIKLPEKAYDIDTHEYYDLSNVKSKLIQKIKIPHEKFIFIGNIKVYHWSKKDEKTRIYICGIQVFKKIKTVTKKKIYIFGIPVYSAKK